MLCSRDTTKLVFVDAFLNNRLWSKLMQWLRSQMPLLRSQMHPFIMVARESKTALVEKLLSRSQRVWNWLHFAKKDVKNFFFLRIILEELIELVVRRRSCLGRQNSDFRCVQEFDLVR